MRFAFDAAARYETELVAMRVWRDVGYAPSVPTLSFETADLREQAQRVLAEQLAGWPQQYPGVPVHEVVQGGHPVAELAAADTARLLVVGHRGRGVQRVAGVGGRWGDPARVVPGGRPPLLEQLRPGQKLSVPVESTSARRSPTPGATRVLHARRPSLERRRSARSTAPHLRR
ncbi:universal stress protein [Saccharopolyspora sp. ASAGF58]|uniref:universal stress protein n=1 Tax=Saccharopolyspora sp. ASAGF58 TaxID=2719023 RepID=UPI003530054A